MRAARLAVALFSAMSLASSGQETLRTAAAHASTVAQDMPVRLSADGRVYSAIAPSSMGYVIFSNVVVDVDRNPTLQVNAPLARSRWWVHLGLHGERMTNTYSATRSALVSVNLLGSIGWRGTKTIDVMVQFKEDINVVRFDLSGEADKDIVFEAGKGASASRFGENEVSLQCFVETGHKNKGLTANGLPPDRVVSSTDPELGSYLLLPYQGVNAIEIPTLREAPAESHVIDVPNFCYTKIGIVGASSGGDASFTLILNYEDGTATTNWFEADDWYTRSRGCQAVVTNMDRAIFSDGAIEDSNHFNLYEFVVSDLDHARKLDSIVLGNDPHRWPDTESRFTAVMAVNGRADVLGLRAESSSNP